MAYDEARQNVVMFGGTSGGCTAPTWTWDGTGWTRLEVPGPQPRNGHAMVFDRARGVVLLFGGTVCGAGERNDTWTWDGTRWTQLQPAQSPPARRNHALVYDSWRREVLLFGGSTPTISETNDTWAWNGSYWVPRFAVERPPGRNDHAMAFDETRGLALLFGGAWNQRRQNDTWAFDGARWTALTASPSPPQQTGQSMVYDRAARLVVLFKGNSSSSSAETWWWDGTWRNVSRAGQPRSRHWAAMAYDAARDEVVLYGGTGFSSIGSETWAHSVPRIVGSFTEYGQGCHGLTLDAAPGSTPTIGQTFASQLRGVPPTATAGFMAIGLSRGSIGGVQLPLSLFFLQMPGCWLHNDLRRIDPSVVLAGATGTHTLAVPNISGLLGGSFFLQAVVAAPGINPLGVITSNGGQVRVGN